jgi:hypothetical protein
LFTIVGQTSLTQALQPTDRDRHTSIVLFALSYTHAIQCNGQPSDTSATPLARPPHHQECS